MLSYSVLTTQPTNLGVALYAYYLYGLLVLQLVALLYVFCDLHGLSFLYSTLPFLGPLIGVLVA